MVLAAKFNDLFPAMGSAQNEMLVTPPFWATMRATAANRQGDRSLLANAKFRLQLLPIQSLSRELMSKNRRDANAISAIMR